MIKQKESISYDTGKYEEVSEEEINRIKLTVADNPVLIFVFSTTDENPEITEENYAATCCAIQNLQLAAHSLNLGVGWSTGNMAKLKNLDQLFNLVFIISANINPDIRQINAPHESQKIGSSIGCIC